MIWQLAFPKWVIRERERNTNLDGSWNAFCYLILEVKTITSVGRIDPPWYTVRGDHSKMWLPEGEVIRGHPGGWLLYLPCLFHSYTLFFQLAWELCKFRSWCHSLLGPHYFVQSTFSWRCLFCLHNKLLALKNRGGGKCKKLRPRGVSYLNQSISYYEAELVNSALGPSDLKPVFFPFYVWFADSDFCKIFSTTCFLSVSSGEN